MAHEVESMAYFGQVPWHGLGTKLENVATAEQAIAAAKLDWEVETRPVYLSNLKSDDKSRFERIPDRVAVRRKTDGKVYQLVSEKYVPVQNKEAFAFFDSVVGSEEAKYHTAGSLRDGAVIWMLAQMNHGNGSIGIKGEEVQKYLILTNSHNGEFALQMYFTPIRVVCMNTLSASMSSKATTFYSRHVGNIQGRVEIAKEVLGLTNQFFGKWEEQAKYLAEKTMRLEDMPEFLRNAFMIDSNKPTEEIWKPTLAAMERVPVLMECGKGMDNPDIKGTRWAAYNALVEWVDYEKGNNRESTTAESRLYGAWFGSGAEMKRRAWNWLLKN